MINNKTIAVVILNYNDWMTTKKLVNSIKSYTIIDHIVVVDNHSSDDSFEKMNDLVGGRVHLIQSPVNGGYSSGNNYGIKYAVKNWTPDIVVIANPDVEFSEDFLVKIIDCIGKDDVYAASGVTLSPNGEIQMIGGKINSYSDDLVECLVLSKRLFAKSNSKPHYDKKICEVELLSGSLFAIDTARFNEIGLFDENVFLYCEERIIGRKFADRNWKMVINAETSYIHNHAVTIKRNLSRYNMIKEVFKSRMYYQKTYNHIGLFRRGLLRFFMMIGLAERKLYWSLSQCRGGSNDG